MITDEIRQSFPRKGEYIVVRLTKNYMVEFVYDFDVVTKMTEELFMDQLDYILAMHEQLENVFGNQARELRSKLLMKRKVSNAK